MIKKREKQQAVVGLWPQRVQIVPGDQSACHLNSAVVYVSDRIPGAQMVRGYGLSKDRLWRQHSWLVTAKNLIETTEKFSQYSGCVLSAEEREAMTEVQFLRRLKQAMAAST